MFAAAGGDDSRAQLSLLTVWVPLQVRPNPGKHNILNGKSSSLDQTHAALPSTTQFPGVSLTYVVEPQAIQMSPFHFLFGTTAGDDDDNRLYLMMLFLVPVILIIQELRERTAILTTSCSLPLDVSPAVCLSPVLF